MKQLLLVCIAALSIQMTGQPTQPVETVAAPPQNAVVAQDKPATVPFAQARTEVRRHLSAVRADGSLLYVFTVISNVDDESSTKVALIRDWKDETWRLQLLDDFQRQTVTQEITHLPTGEFVRLSFKIPMKAKTRIDALTEGHAQIGNPESSVMTANPPTTIETRFVSRTADESDWKNRETSADLRSDIRISLSTAFLDGAERMRHSLIRHDVGLNIFDRVLLETLSHTPGCESAARYAKVVQLAPDCKFDKDLGRPCSTEQEKRVARAEKKGITLTRY